MQNKLVSFLAFTLFTVLISAMTTFWLFQSYYLPVALQQAEKTAQSKAQLTSHINSAPLSIPEDFVSTADKITNSAVGITVYKNDYRMAGGSGVIISRDGYIVTNYHVVEGSTFFEVTLANKEEKIAKLIGTDPSTDLALLKIEANNLSPISIGDSDRTKVGEWVLAVGNPFGLTSTVTAGIVSAKARSIQILRDRDYSIESFIQTDAAVNPGNSGGALVNAAGELIGINTAIVSNGGGYEGFSFAVPSNLVRKIVRDLREHGKAQRGILGVEINDVDSEIARKLNLDKVEGVLVRNVRTGTTASSAGLRANDVITHINDIKTSSTAELQEQIARLRPGNNISISYIRDGIRSKKSNVRLKAING